MARLIAKVAAAVLAAAVAAVLALQGAGQVALAPEVVVLLITAAAVLSAGSTSSAAVAEWRRRRAGADRETADQLLTAAGWAIVDLTGLDFRELGLAAYRVRRGRWTPWRRRLHRLHRVRARRRTAASQVVWAPGKGIIGACVARGQVVAQDLGADYDAVWPCTEEEWATAVPTEVRQGLSYAEFLDVREKYEVVVATPLLDDAGPETRVVGCVVLDGPAGSLQLLSGDDVLGVLDSAAQALLRRGP